MPSNGSRRGITPSSVMPSCTARYAGASSSALSHGSQRRLCSSDTQPPATTSGTTTKSGSGRALATKRTALMNPASSHGLFALKARNAALSSAQGFLRAGTSFGCVISPQPSSVSSLIKSLARVWPT